MKVIYLVAAAVLAALSNGASAAGCAKTDLGCRGNAGISAAIAACPAHVERLSEFSVRWTDKPRSPRFDRFSWTDEPGGALTYIGDSVEFQNAFGAYKPMRYFCDMTPDGTKVLDARAYQGRLPIK